MVAISVSVSCHNLTVAGSRASASAIVARALPIIASSASTSRATAICSILAFSNGPQPSPVHKSRTRLQPGDAWISPGDQRAVRVPGATPDLASVHLVSCGGDARDVYSKATAAHTLGPPGACARRHQVDLRCNSFISAVYFLTKMTSFVSPPMQLRRSARRPTVRFEPLGSLCCLNGSRKLTRNVLSGLTLASLQIAQSGR